MAARTLQPSEYEIQREVEALRDIRRRSQNPGALTIDPDLPNQSPPSSPTANYWSPKPKSPSGTDANPLTSPAAGSSNASLDHNVLEGVVNPNNPADDPFHLFWVPASVHPEIAPAEFRAFLQEHARNPPSTDGSEGLIGRNSSLSSRSSLSRQRSKLSRQYQPKENDRVEDENVVPLRRNHSHAQRVPQLTISDLQKLEELAEEASQSADPTRLRNVLRRSLSLNMSPTAIEKMDVMPDLGDEADVPIIIPPPGQILRRAARTKIRKPGLPGDGAGHRFGASRRQRNSGEAQSQGRTSGEMSSNENGEIESPGSRRQTLSDEAFGGQQRPDSFSEETSIFDAYARDDDEELAPALSIIAPLPDSRTYDQHAKPAAPEIQPSLLEALGPVLQQPQPQHLGMHEPSSESDLESRTPSPPNESPVQETPPQQYPPTQHQPYPQFQQPQPQPQPFTPELPSHYVPVPPQQPPSGKQKEKDKKGLFGKWGSDKGGKKGKGAADQRGEKEKEGFFGSLFGGKKKQDDTPTGVSAGREAAQALLGGSKSAKNYVPPPSPGLAPGSPNFARYPIHVERAIYRLSHIKLANPRRPLYEQVLISNLMFWYLGVINKAQTANSANSETATAQAEKEKEEREKKEKEAKEKAEKERLEKEQRERELEMKKRESPKRGPLTKAPVGGQVGRRAEMPVKGPQYEMQQQVMQKEYNNGYGGQGSPPRNIPNGQQPYGRVPNGPQGPPNPQQQQPYHQPPPQAQLYPAQGQSYQQPYPPSQGQLYPNAGPRQGPPMQGRPPGPPPDHFYQSNENGAQRGGLPPGAMAPVGMAPQRSPPPGGSFQQPPPQPRQGQHQMGYGGPESGLPMGGNTRGPVRSMSANASPAPNPAAMNGSLRKGNSARAVTSYDSNRRPRTAEGGPRQSEKEDLPLAVYQQQQRR